jgi:hypothetical protein
MAGKQEGSDTVAPVRRRSVVVRRGWAAFKAFAACGVPVDALPVFGYRQKTNEKYAVT